MKIARIVLTATILLSLKSTLFCSSPESHDTIKLERKDSFDPLRDRAGYAKGFFSSFIGYSDKALVVYTYQNLGKDFQGKETRFGSNQEAIDAWDKQIQTVQEAEQFLASLSANPNIIPTSHPIRQKAIAIVQAAYQQDSIINDSQTINTTIEEAKTEEPAMPTTKTGPKNKRAANRKPKVL